MPHVDLHPSLDRLLSNLVVLGRVSAAEAGEIYSVFVFEQNVGARPPQMPYEFSPLGQLNTRLKRLEAERKLSTAETVGIREHFREQAVSNDAVRKAVKLAGRAKDSEEVELSRLQAAFERAKARAGAGGVHFRDVRSGPRPSSASANAEAERLRSAQFGSEILADLRELMSRHREPPAAASPTSE